MTRDRQASTPATTSETAGSGASWQRLMHGITRLTRFLLPSRRRVVALRVEGACRMTGNCCKNLILTDGGRPVATQRQFRRLKRKEPSYAMFVPNEAPGPDAWLRFHCQNLGDDNRCGIYPTRPEMCRRYPQIEMFSKGGSLLAGCGYRLVREPRGANFARVFAAELKRDVPEAIPPR